MKTLLSLIMILGITAGVYAGDGAAEKDDASKKVENAADKQKQADDAGKTKEPAADSQADSAADGKTDDKPLTDVNEIVRRANNMAYYQGDDGRSRVKMLIVDKKGQKRSREFIILRKDVAEGGDQKYYVYFLAPADVRKMVFMVHKHADIKKDDDRWLYLPSLDLVNRISAGDKRTSFVGSDFLYEDVSGRSLAEDRHELVETTKEHYVVRNAPIKPETVEFKHYDVFIDRKTFLPMLMEYYDGKGKVYRRIKSVEVKKIQGFPTVTKSLVEDLSTGSKTAMVFSDIKYNIKLADIFTERFLRRPPRQEIK